MNKYFNKSILNLDFKKILLPLILMTLLIFSMVTYNVLISEQIFKSGMEFYAENDIEISEDDMKNEVKHGRIGYLRDSYDDLLPFTLIYAFILVGLVFVLDKDTGVYEKLKTMPLKKSQIYLSKLGVTIIGALLPFIVNGLIMGLANILSKNLSEYYSISRVVSWLLKNSRTMIQGLAFLSLIATAVDSFLSFSSFSIIMFLYPIIMYGVLRGNIRLWFGEFSLKPVIFTIKNASLAILTGKYLNNIYIVFLIIIAYLISYRFFMDYKLEEVAFIKVPWLKPIYKWGLILSSLLSLAYFIGKRIIFVYDIKLWSKLILMLVLYGLGGFIGKKVYDISIGKEIGLR